MDTLIVQVLLCLAAAALLGGAVGWWLRTRRAVEALTDQHRIWSTKLEVKDEELSETYRRLERVELQKGTFSEQLASSRQQTRRAEQEAQDAKAEERQLTQQLEASKSEIEGQTAEIQRLRDGAETNRQLEQKRQIAETELNSSAAERARLRAEATGLQEAIDRKAETVVHLEQELADLKRGSQRLEILATERAAEEQREHAELLRRHESTVAEQQHLLATAAETDATEARLRKALQEERNRNAELQALHRAVVSNLDGEKQELELQISLLRRSSTELATSSGHQPDNDLEARITDLTANKERLEQELLLSRERESKLDTLKDQRQAFVVSQNTEIAQLRDRCAVLERRRGAPMARDDLTLIAGIGPVIASRLHALGINEYRQIAYWTDADVERMAGKLGSFPKRIQRGNWVEAARTLHYEKHGEHLPDPGE